MERQEGQERIKDQEKGGWGQVQQGEFLCESKQVVGFEQIVAVGISGDGGVAWNRTGVDIFGVYCDGSIVANAQRRRGGENVFLFTGRILFGVGCGDCLDWGFRKITGSIIYLLFCFVLEE